ncbi:MAG TPA: hypothetical protein VEB66_12145 [Opitutaceae bacterium]|nr:hypothetical protein [Opitutaceae bacterium]
MLPFVALLLVAGCASTDRGEVVAFQTSFMELPFSAPPQGWALTVRRGDTRDAVLAACGRPAAHVGADVWIYPDVPSTADPRAGFDTMVVAFHRERVAQLRLVNGDALRAYLQSLPRVPLEEVRGR